MAPSPPERVLNAWRAAGCVAGAIASGAFVSLALAAPHGAAARDTARAVLAPTAAELALNTLPRPRAAAPAEPAARFCGRIRLGFDVRCRAFGALFD